ncbi:MAG: helix-turn-helix domain-containing protein, partial [Chthoniobacteraceae bacterium]
VTAGAVKIEQRKKPARRMKTERFIPQQATYTAKEAAAYLKVSERQIRNFIARKLLRKSKAQAKTLIPGEDVETLLARTS